MEITGHDANRSTNKRQDETQYTVWFIDTQSGLLFDDEQSARTFCLMYSPKASIVPPLYQ